MEKTCLSYLCCCFFFVFSFCYLKPFFFITCWSVVLCHYYNRLNVGTSKLTQAVPQLMFWFKSLAVKKGRPYNCTVMCNNHVIHLLKVPTVTGDSLLLHRVCGLFKLYSKAEKGISLKKKHKKMSNMLQCLKKSQSVVSNVACINLKMGEVWN